MTEPASDQPAYVLHRRAYRESSFLVELLTQNFGRVSCVVRGGKGRHRKLVEPFNRYVVSWRGRGQLLNVTSLDVSAHYRPSQVHLYAGLYVNELLVRILRPEEPIDDLFETYETTLAGLENGLPVEPVLRSFERELLRELGYEIAFNRDLASGAPICPDAIYTYVPGMGFEVTNGGESAFTGEALLRIAVDDYSDPATRIVAKRVMRQALRFHIGDKPLASRELFLKGQI